MNRLAGADIILATMMSLVAAQGKPPAAQKYNVKRCTPKVVSYSRRPKQEAIHTRQREKSTGFSPIIAYQILDTGEVTHAYVKRSWGIADIDALALNWVRGTKYNLRSGCGVIETQADVTP